MISHHHLLCLNKAISPQAHLTQKWHRHSAELSSSCFIKQLVSKMKNQGVRKASSFPSSQLTNVASQPPYPSCSPKRSEMANVSFGCTRSYFKSCLSSSDSNLTSTSVPRRQRAAPPFLCPGLQLNQEKTADVRRGAQTGRHHPAPRARRGTGPSGRVPGDGHKVSPKQLGCAPPPRPAATAAFHGARESCSWARGAGGKSPSVPFCSVAFCSVLFYSLFFFVPFYSILFRFLNLTSYYSIFNFYLIWFCFTFSFSFSPPLPPLFFLIFIF